MKMPPPTEAELKEAFTVIARAEDHVKELADAAGIPRATVYVSAGYYDAPQVTVRTNKRLFVNHDGKRNLESANFLYRSIERELATISKWIKSKAA